MPMPIALMRQQQAKYASDKANFATGFPAALGALGLTNTPQAAPSPAGIGQGGLQARDITRRRLMGAQGRASTIRSPLRMLTEDVLYSAQPKQLLGS